jgi:hypothetical protein
MDTKLALALYDEGLRIAARTVPGLPAGVSRWLQQNLVSGGGSPSPSPTFE